MKVFRHKKLKNGGHIGYVTGDRNEDEAQADLEAMLARPSIPVEGMFSDGECFDPWELFPAVYGSYSEEFDDMAIGVLEDIRYGTHTRNDLASQMFREMLCTAGFCDYGTSPRSCFASGRFNEQLPALLERWREYAQIKWSK